MPLPRCRTTMMLASLALDLALAVAAQPATNFVLLLGE
jgi:Spy/CpxP family protein refolding chaperone